MTDVSYNNYDIITKALLYKQLNPPHYRTYTFNSNGYLGSSLSKSVFLIINVHGIGTIRIFMVYDIKNKVVKSRFYYYSEKDREKDMKKNRKRRLGRTITKTRYVEDKTVSHNIVI
jgi:hypothetical protein